MTPELRTETLKRMLALIDDKQSQLGESGAIAVSSYSSQERLQAELDVLFQDFPVVVAHGSQLHENGSFVTLTVGHMPVLVNRDRDGHLRAFINSCRHRGAKLTDLPCGKAKSFKCPYHAWTYMDDGALKYVPNKEAFPELDSEGRGLVELAVKEQAGFIWLLPNKMKLESNALDIKSYLSGVDEDLLEFELDQHIVKHADVLRPACNWKLVIDAFSEGYHLKTLHKDSVKPFFHEHGTVFEKMGCHSRSVGARNDIVNARSLPESEWDFRAWTTPFYTLFPNTILVFHPDWVSRITVFPNGSDHSVVYHDMLVPGDADLQASYWDKTFALINQQVFAAEDIAVCENIQSATRSGADTHWLTGGLETPVYWFHQACDAALAKNQKK